MDMQGPVPSDYRGLISYLVVRTSHITRDVKFRISLQDEAIAGLSDHTHSAVIQPRP